MQPCAENQTFSGPESPRSTPVIASCGFSSQQWCKGQCARNEVEAGPTFDRRSHLEIPFRKGAGSLIYQ